MTFGVADMTRAVAFYDAALAPLGLCRLVDFRDDDVRVVGYGDGQPCFWMAEERATSGLFHVAFRARCRADVVAFHAAAMMAGGTDNGPPGLRPHYHADYYAAFVRDPDGHNIEAVCHLPADALAK